MWATQDAVAILGKLKAAWWQVRLLSHSMLQLPNDPLKIKIYHMQFEKPFSTSDPSNLFETLY